MADCQLRKILSRFNAAAIGLDVPCVSCPQLQISSHALPAWKAGLVVDTRQSTISNFNYDASYHIRRS